MLTKADEVINRVVILTIAAAHKRGVRFFNCREEPLTGVNDILKALREDDEIIIVQPERRTTDAESHR